MSGAAELEGWLREILRCPACRGPLRDRRDVGGAAFLDCAGACADNPAVPGGRSYRIEDGIPVLLVDDAVPRPG